MRAQDIFAKATQSATSCLQYVRTDYLKRRTPCTEWDARALINHMVYELLWVPEIVRGKTVQEVGDRYEGDVLGSDFRTAWQHAADAAMVAVRGADDSQLAHLSYGDVPLEHYIQEIGGDVLIHSWDLAQSMQTTLLFDEDVAQSVYNSLKPRQEELVASGRFAPALTPATDALVQEKLLCLTGRSPDWQ